MKKQLIKFFANLFCIAALAGIGSAKSAERTRFEVPFDFTVNDQPFPSGQYFVERLSAANPGIVVLKQSDGKAKAALLVQPTSNLPFGNRLKLSFKFQDGNYVLVAILAVSNKYIQDSLPEK